MGVPLPLYALEGLSEWGVFDPARPDPWGTELLHFTLHSLAVVLLVVGQRRAVRAEDAARLAAVSEVF